MVRRLTLVFTLVAMVGLIAAPAVSAAPPARGDALSQQFGDAIVTVNSLAQGADGLVANVTITNATTGAQLTDDVTAAVSEACDILTLDLGPLDLDVLGLVIQLDEVNLDIIAEPGPGNLLGNLLCAVAGLLDGPSPLAGLIDRLLNIINGLLG